MSQYRETFSIAGVNYEIVSNFEISKLLKEPQPYNLHINYRIEESLKGLRPFKVAIQNRAGQLKVSQTKTSMKVSGNVNPMFKDGYNQQFGLFGNKGLINKFILHTLEKNYGITVFHASAIIHPLKQKAYIAIGGSGSGKSVFAGQAISVGWKSLATEHVLVKGGQIFRGSRYDNLSPLSVDFYKKELPEAKVLADKRLIEPVGSKIFCDMAAYETDLSMIDFQNLKIGLVVLNLSNEMNSSGPDITDADFLLRTVQQVSSEKVIFPAIFGNEIIATDMQGDPFTRNANIKTLLSQTSSKNVLGGNLNDFKVWLMKRYED